MRGARNQVVAQGIYESWVLGKAEVVSRRLRRYQRSLVTTFKVLGVGLNQALVVAMLIVLPEITLLWRRAAFVGIVIALLLGLVWLHRKFLPNAVVSLEAKRPGILARAWPSILSWLIGASAALAASYAFYLLTGHTTL